MAGLSIFQPRATELDGFEPVLFNGYKSLKEEVFFKLESHGCAKHRFFCGKCAFLYFKVSMPLIQISQIDQ